MAFQRVALALITLTLVLAGCGGAQQAAVPTVSVPVDIATAQPVAATPSVAPSATVSAPSATAAALTPAPEGAALAGANLVAALRRGGYVIYFRHAVTDRAQSDTSLESCTTQRNLNERGRADAQLIGQGFKDLSIPVGRVLSSRYCRAIDTATLAFGRAEPLENLTGVPDAKRDERIAALKRLLANPPQPGTNTVLVAHDFNIRYTTSVGLNEGQAAVFAPGGPEGYTLVGKVRADEWATLASAARAPAPTAAAPRVQEFAVPAGSHPHDVAPAPDGGVWYTAQSSGELGYLNPATGETRTIELGEGSAPHGVIVGPDGAPWITDGGQNAIVRVDPATNAVRVFQLPAGREGANLNTAAFDGAGALWFTGQGGVYGRLDPHSGQIDMWDAPQGRGPYGITATPKGEIYYASLAGSYIARIDTATGQAEVLAPPTGNQGARRVWSDAQGRIWVSEWNAGQVAVYDPVAARWREWKLPGDTPRAYAVYVDEGGAVWLSDFAANALVRFDPASETFTSFPLPSASGSVRQIHGRAGEVWGAESSVDKLIVIRQ